MTFHRSALMPSGDLFNPTLKHATRPLVIMAMGQLLGPAWTADALAGSGELRVRSRFLGAPCQGVFWFRGPNEQIGRIDIRFQVSADKAIRFATEKIGPVLATELPVYEGQCPQVVAEVQTASSGTHPVTLTIHYPPFN